MRIQFKQSIPLSDVEKMFHKRDWHYLTSPNVYPRIVGVEERSDISKRWETVAPGSYIWVDDNVRRLEALTRFIRKLDTIIQKSDDNIPYGIQKKVARIAAKYDLNVGILDRIMLKEGPGHAAYNRNLNAMRVVPEYFIRMGMQRVGGKMVDEFEKTVVHEFGHCVWHKLLPDSFKARWLDEIPDFKALPMDENYTRGSTVNLRGEKVKGEYYTHEDGEFVSQAARLNPREDFAESFAIRLISPGFLDDVRERLFGDMDAIVTDAKVIESKPLTPLPSPSESAFVPVDLQFSERRKVLAQALGDSIARFLGEHSLDGQNVKNVFLFGEYTTPEESPSKIQSVCYIEGLRAGPYHTQDGSVEMHVTGAEEIANSLIYELRDLAHVAEVAQQRPDEDVNKAWIPPNQIASWVTLPGGRRVPIPKKGYRPGKTGTGTKLPKGHVERKQYIKQAELKIKQPIQTKFSQQYHVPEHGGPKAPPHFDFRVKIENRAESFSLPKGLPRLGEIRLAIIQPAHSVDYMGFSGKIPSGYGQGDVKVADQGDIEILEWTNSGKKFRILNGKQPGVYKMMPGKGNAWYVKKLGARKPIKDQVLFRRYRKRFDEAMFTDRRHVMIPRLGGVRAMVYAGMGGENRVYSKYLSKKSAGHVERTDNFPQIRDINLGFKKKTILDGEVFVGNMDISNRLILSLPGRSRDLQRKVGNAKFYVNDVLFLDGDDMRDLPYVSRIQALHGRLKENDNVVPLPMVTDGKEEAFDKLVNRGAMGALFVDQMAPYDEVSAVLLTSPTVSKGMKKRWLDPDEIKSWITIGGRKVPIPKEGRRVSTKGPVEEQYEPSKARLKLSKEMWADGRYGLQPKFDGSRYLVYFEKGGNRVLSRRTSVKPEAGGHVERSDNVPHIRDLANDELSGTVLDGEMVRNDFRTTQRIMGSKPERAWGLQDEFGPMMFIVFDIIKHNGKDVRKLPYKERLKLAGDAVSKAGSPQVKLAPTLFSGKKEAYVDLVKSGFEGVVMKDMEAPYSDQFQTKVKRIETDEFLLTGITEGTGKAGGSMGALKLQRWDDKTGHFEDAGKVGTGFDDKLRQWFKDNIGQLKNKTVVEVKHFGISKDGRKPRGPVFMRIREDLSPEDLQKK